MDWARVTKAHVRIREERARLKREFDERDTVLKSQQQMLEGEMLKHLNETGSESVRTANGTFYRQENLIPNGSDWNAIYDWIKENDAWDMLERRIKRVFVQEYMETHDGALPPGVSAFREFVVRVRRPTS